MPVLRPLYIMTCSVVPVTVVKVFCVYVSAHGHLLSVNEEGTYSASSHAFVLQHMLESLFTNVSKIQLVILSGAVKIWSKTVPQKACALE